MYKFPVFQLNAKSLGLFNVAEATAVEISKEKNSGELIMEKRE
jgi:hypothetical protein